MLPNNKFNIGKGLKIVNVKDNSILNTSFETDQKESVTEQKSTSRMRNMVRTGKLESSAVGSSQVIGNRSIKDQSAGHLVSARYTRRRLSAISYNALANFHDAKNEISEQTENEQFADLASRRMSAPELPPISSGGKNSAIINNTNLTARSNTFHNYKFSHKNRKIIHSDSSLQGVTSRASSASSQRSRQRVLSAGAERQLQTSNHVIITDPIRETTSTKATIDRRNPKEEMPAAVAPVGRCPPVPGYKRSKSKISVNGYNSNLTTPRKMVHSHSESQLNPQRLEKFRKQNVAAGAGGGGGGIKRINSDNRLADVTKRNVKNSQAGASSVKRDPHANGKGSLSNLNGLRKYSSTLGLNSNDKQSDESDQKKEIYDSDSDSEKDNRVIEWIIGVNDVAEPPDEQLIEYVDEPPQRDTAIRIIYDGDT